jgi:hypothetical protein
MKILFEAAKLVVALTLIAASFIYIFNPRRAEVLIKYLAIGIAGLVACVAVFQQVLSLPIHADASWFVVLFVLSAVAYAVREFRKRGTKHEAHQDRGAERMRLP